jgi:outer membrane protein TolC
VALTVKNNRWIAIDAIQRDSEQFDLLTAQDKFNPHAVINAEHIRHRGSFGNLETYTVGPTATLLTQVGTKITTSLNSNISRSADGIRQSGSSLSFTVLQPLLKGAGSNVNTASVRMAEIADQIKLLGMQKTAIDQVRRVIFGYLDLQRLRMELNLATEGHTRAVSLVAINDSLIQAGRMAASERVEAEAEVVNRELAVEEASNQLDAARLNLIAMLALEPTTQFDLIEPLVAPQTAVDTREALRLALEHSPDVLISALSTEQIQLSEMLAKNQRLWDVALVAGSSNVRVDTTPISPPLGLPAGRIRDSYVGVQVSIPLGDLTARQVHLRAMTDMRTDQLRHADLLQNVERLVLDATRDLQNKWRQLNIAQRSIALSRKKLTNEREKLSLGRSSNFIVLNFEADLRQAESNELTACVGYLNAATTLDALTGTTLKKWKISLIK